MDEKKKHAVEFVEWMQRYSLHDYSKRPYKFRTRQNVGERNPQTWTAEELYNKFEEENDKFNTTIQKQP